jgi:thymidylate synthase
MFSLIVCVDKSNGIGMSNGDIPFKHSEDLKNFKNLTMNNIIVMGRKTYESLTKPLKNRINVVISKTLDKTLEEKYDNLVIYNNNKEFINDIFINNLNQENPKIKKEFVHSKKNKKEIFIIGGVGVYKYFLEHNFIKKIFLTKVKRDYNCDINLNFGDFYNDHFGFNSNNNKLLFNKIKSITYYKNSNNIKNKFFKSFSEKCEYNEYEIYNKEEFNFLETLKDILICGVFRNDRTNVGTYSKFGLNLTFSLENNIIPLGTTKKVPLRMVFEELMWFIRGQTDSKILEKKGVNVWKGNTSRRFLDKCGLVDFKEGETGSSYGHNFRRFGKPYIIPNKECKEIRELLEHTNFYNQLKGFDQLNNVIHLLKNNPYSRRIIINLWNPNSLETTPLPPCLYCYQFYVEPDKHNNPCYLSCLATQRSSDISLAGFWNISTISLLTYMLGSMTGLKPKKLIWSIGDAHIYKNQLEAVNEQLNRNPLYYPKLFLKETAPSIHNNKSIEEFEYGDMVLVDYNPYKSIKSVMNV